MGVPPVGSTPEQPSSAGPATPADASDASNAPTGDPRANFAFDLPARRSREGTTEPASTDATSRRKPHDEALQEFLDALSRGPLVSSIPNRPVGQIGSLDTIAADSGVAVGALEDQIRRDMSAFCERAVATRHVDRLKHQALIDKFYNLYVLSGSAESPGWLSAMRDFDSFIAHYCPQADPLAKRALIDCVESFVRISLLPLRLYRPDFVINGGDAALPAYDDPGNWIRLNTAWVNMQVIDEARQLVSDGSSAYQNLLTHDTGSAVLSQIGENNAIWSAQRALQHGGKLVTGEYAYSAYQQAHTSLDGRQGHNNVYTSRDNLSSKKYTIQRWFNESPVTFGINEEKQREYDRAHRGTAPYIEVGTEVAVGPVVPLENIAAIAAPKANEAMFRAWIEAHCPSARFVSYEAVDLLDYADKRVRMPPAQHYPRGGFDRDFLA
ncbi:hypothetical protein GWC77_08925 [Paraburkholderia sp. NMBU_R16]|uniref:hypothetical protein n=1 Tax=Paraburkholderia sp. NMBU_R16 TaxID=2698676 RepID=UPI00156636EF|nr:hypothetical protein [Paraburkholderia sp. NMBU_R16]NRO96057.1 hypothetical protein [Paraburkholderia sp. NMBU_R16]